MVGTVILKIISALAILYVAIQVQREGLHLWAGLIAIAAAGLLASYTFSWSIELRWLCWAAVAVTASVGLAKAVHCEIERNERNR
ncbi:hypothetical protein A9762_12315 [Pandoraea sp. ISTKB]|nr:hypothetical protein A9762_12315 [Pandoraea sp. ISTKB]